MRVRVRGEVGRVLVWNETSISHEALQACLIRIEENDLSSVRAFYLLGIRLVDGTHT